MVEDMSIFLVPVLTMLFRFTSSINHLYYVSADLIFNKYFPVLYIVKGPWYWVQSIFETFCFIIANYMYLNIYHNSKGVIRRQSIVLLSASLLPWFIVLVNLANISPLNIDYAPFTLSLSVVLFFIAILRFQFLNIKPMARDRLFQSTDNGIIVNLM